MDSDFGKHSYLTSRDRQQIEWEEIEDFRILIYFLFHLCLKSRSNLPLCSLADFKHNCKGRNSRTNWISNLLQNLQLQVCDLANGIAKTFVVGFVTSQGQWAIYEPKPMVWYIYPFKACDPALLNKQTNFYFVLQLRPRKENP